MNNLPDEIIEDYKKNLEIVEDCRKKIFKKRVCEFEVNHGHAIWKKLLAGADFYGELIK
jgi:hypothetical protein